MKTIRFSCLQKSFERADACVFRKSFDFVVLVKAHMNMRREIKMLSALNVRLKFRRCLPVLRRAKLGKRFCSSGYDYRLR
jgi:GTP cyclohydrolase III